MEKELGKFDKDLGLLRDQPHLGVDGYDRLRKEIEEMRSSDKAQGPLSSGFERWLDRRRGLGNAQLDERSKNETPPSDQFGSLDPKRYNLSSYAAEEDLQRIKCDINLFLEYFHNRSEIQQTVYGVSGSNDKLRHADPKLKLKDDFDGEHRLWLDFKNEIELVMRAVHHPSLSLGRRVKMLGHHYSIGNYTLAEEYRADIEAKFPCLKGASMVLLDKDNKLLDVAKVDLWKDGVVGHWDEGVALYILGLFHENEKSRSGAGVGVKLNPVQSR